MKAIDRIFTMSLFERRAAYKCWVQFGINRFELWMLCAFSSMLLMYRSKTMSKHELFNTITGNSNVKRKFEGYWLGCKTKGVIKEVLLKNGQSGWLLSPLGLKVLQVFEGELVRLEGMQKARADAKSVERPERTLEELSNLTLSDLGSRYKAIL